MYPAGDCWLKDLAGILEASTLGRVFGLGQMQKCLRMRRMCTCAVDCYIVGLVVDDFCFSVGTHF